MLNVSPHKFYELESSNLIHYQNYIKNDTKLFFKIQPITYFSLRQIKWLIDVKSSLPAEEQINF